MSLWTEDLIVEHRHLLRLQGQLHIVDSCLQLLRLEAHLVKLTAFKYQDTGFPESACGVGGRSIRKDCVLTKHASRSGEGVQNQVFFRQRNEDFNDTVSENVNLFDVFVGFENNLSFFVELEVKFVR